MVSVVDTDVQPIFSTTGFEKNQIPWPQLIV
ncbi:hypothetical protein SSYM_0693, partial [Serratia symbiotica str. Tucson]